MKNYIRLQKERRQFKQRSVILSLVLLLLPLTASLADHIYLESSDPAHMTAGVSSDTITVRFTFSEAIDHENMYWDQFMLYPWGPYTKYTLHDRWFSEDSTTAYAVISHEPDTDFVWSIMELPGADSINMMENIQIVNYTTRDEISDLTVTGQLSYESVDFESPATGQHPAATGETDPYWGVTIVSLLDDISWLGEPEGFMGSLPHIVNIGTADPETGEYLIENVRPGEYYMSTLNFRPVRDEEDPDPILGILGLDWEGSPPVTITVGDESVTDVNIVLYDSLPDIQPDFDGDIFVESSYPAHMAAGVSTDSITVRFSFNAAIDDENISWEQFMLFPHRQYTLHDRWFAVNHMTAYAVMTHEPDTDYVWRIDDLPGLDGGHMESMQVINYTTRDEISELKISGQLTLSPELEDWLNTIDDARQDKLVAEAESEFTWGMATLALFDDISWFGGPDGMMGSLPHHANIGKVDPQTGEYLIENVRAGEYWLLAAHLEPVKGADYDPFMAFYGGADPQVVTVTDESLEDIDIELDTEFDTYADNIGGPEIPDVLALHQNYPNPFNPFTRIYFDLPSDSDVTLEVFDLLGQHIATLSDGHSRAGRHYVDFDASTISSGIYLYRLTANQQMQIRKMTVVK